MKSQATSIEEYLAQLPSDRREPIEAVRKVILKNLPKGYEEVIQYGMISYVVPHSLYPAGYHCDPTQPLCYAGLASQKNHMAVYLMTVYGNPEIDKWFRDEYAKSGKKLDMGKSCVRFKKVDDLPLNVIGQVIAKTPAKAYIASVESTLAGRKSKR